MANCLLCWPNRFTFGTLIANNGEPALPVTNLANDQGSADQGYQSVGTACSFIVIAPADAPWRAFGLHNTNLTAAATVRWRVFTLGNLLAWDSGTVPAGVVAGYRQSVVVAPLGIVGNRAECDLNDPANPDGFVNVAQAYAGPAWQTSRNFDYVSSPGRTSQVTEAVTRGGGVVTRPDWTKRTFDLSLSGIRASEVWSQLADLDLWAARGNNVLFVPNPDGATVQQESLLGQLKPASGVTYPNKAADARGWRATITERL